MNDVITQLGSLYDELVKLQADAKTSAFSDAQLVHEPTNLSQNLGFVLPLRAPSIAKLYEGSRRSWTACSKQSSDRAWLARNLVPAVTLRG